MGFFVLSHKQISYLGLALGLYVVMLVVAVASRTSWQHVIQDKTDSAEIVDIETVHVVKELPVSSTTLTQTLQFDGAIPTIPISVYNLSTQGFFKKPPANFFQQLKQALQDKALPDMEQQKYAFYFDVTRSQVEHLKTPHLFFHWVNGDWQLYFDNTLLADGTVHTRYKAVKLPDQLPEKFRMTFVVKNRFKERISGFYFTHGLSFRSEMEVNWALANLPMQHQIPRIVAVLLFFSLFVMALGTIVATPKFLDLWGFAGFTAAAACMVLIETPFFWQSFDWGKDGLSVDYNRWWIVVNGSFALLSPLFTIAFFRLRGLVLGLFILCVITWVLTTGIAYWPTDTALRPSDYNEIAAWNLRLLILGNFTAAVVGLFAMHDQLIRFKNQGFTAREQKMRRRILQALVFLSGNALMLVSFVFGLTSQSTTAGPDIFLMASTLPTAVMQAMLVWMTRSANKERLQLAPAVEVLDELVLELGKKAIYQMDGKNKPVLDQYGYKVKRAYNGALALFDLKGFTLTDSLKDIDHRHAVEVDQFLRDVEHDLSALFHDLFPRWRFKWLGDEMSWAYFAKDQDAADAMVKRLVVTWQEHAQRLCYKWKADLVERLGPFIDPKVLEALDYVDVHVAFCRLDHLTIKPGLGGSLPDYDSPSYTRISRAFKLSTHTRIALFTNTGERLVQDSNIKGYFEPASTLGDGNTTGIEKNKPQHEVKLLADTGFLVWDEKVKASANQAS